VEEGGNVAVAGVRGDGKERNVVVDGRSGAKWDWLCGLDWIGRWALVEWSSKSHNCAA
jgi:hypothetical protein